MKILGGTLVLIGIGNLYTSVTLIPEALERAAFDAALKGNESEKERLQRIAPVYFYGSILLSVGLIAGGIYVWGRK